MPNHYFRFKQFTIRQDQCAMKVCTDACLFGAWMAEKVKNQESSIQKVLDIGTGTGLLSLMLAQKNTTAIIDAVEIDDVAAMQAQQNFQSSQWKERLYVHNNSIQQFNQLNNQLYDLIISNPPFFENDLKSDDAKRNLALHSSELSLEELLQSISLQLNIDGLFAVLLPYHRTDYFEKLATNKYHLQHKVLVKQTLKHNYFRSMLFFGTTAVESVKTIITIRNENNQYSKEFIELLKDYYLHL